MRHFALVLMIASLAGCKKQDESAEPLTLGEAGQALDEAALSMQAETLTGNSVEISTSFTIGGAVEAAAQELAAFYASQLPCAEVTLSGATLTIAYGVNAGNCTYNGNTFSGSHAVTLSKNEEAEVVVDHVWTDFSNGRVDVSGDATVTWSLANQTRHVVHQLDWTRAFDGKTATGSGDRLQGALNSDILTGITVEGTRDWSGEAGDWHLDIDGVEARWIDPVPQAGVYALTTPFEGKSLSMAFERVDEDTIHVTVESGNESFGFNVSKLGVVTPD